MRPRSLAARALVAATVLGFAAGACAKTVSVPETSPKVTFEVPDDWTVTPTPIGLEIAPSDKSALIVVGLIKRDRAILTKWQKDATQAMKDFGVAFDPQAKKPVGGAKAAPQTLFSGAPTIGTPEQGPQAATAFEDKDKAGLSLEQLTGRPAPKGAKIPLNGLIIYGASYLGTPVDAEFIDFDLSPKELFLMQQESGKSDTRIAPIIDSVRRVEK